MAIPTDTIDKLEETYRSISALGAQLSEEQWKSPSELPGWTVQDNLSHLVGTERSLEGLPLSDREAPESGHVKNPIGAFNEREVDARRGRTGAEVLAEWVELIETRISSLRNGDDAYYEAPAMTPTGPGTVADFLHIRIMDCWAHEQDMRRAVGIPGALDNASAAHSVDRLIRTLPIVVGKRAATPEGKAVRIEITGSVARSLVYEVTDGRATLVEEPSSPPLTTVTMDTETFMVLALGRRDAASTGGAVEIEGDRGLGERIVANLAMMI